MVTEIPENGSEVLLSSVFHHPEGYIYALDHGHKDLWRVSPVHPGGLCEKYVEHGKMKQMAFDVQSNSIVFLRPNGLMKVYLEVKFLWALLKYTEHERNATR